MLAASIVALMVGMLLQPSGLTEVIFSIISFTIILIVLSAVFYLAGIVVVGGRRALFKDAFAISVLGTLVLIVCLSVFSLEIAIILSLIAWLLLVRHYYETGLLGSIAVGLTSVIVAVVILLILSILLGISNLSFSWLPFLLTFYLRFKQ
ncbi:MAG: hypothetical protein JSW14_07505 [Candidatus Bathyarchaeum sp.]|nr:MAG: hypothetical protein JSW14_07505 [Candidatus Bathyarchaeum sp.]